MAQFAAVAAKFRVELAKMRTTAAELQREVDELHGSADGLAGSPNFGDPNVVGVSRLGARHQTIIAPTQQLISDIQGGIAAGEEALRVAAARYEDVDNRNSEKIDSALTEALDERGFEEDPDLPGGMRPV